MHGTAHRGLLQCEQAVLKGIVSVGSELCLWKLSSLLAPSSYKCCFFFFFFSVACILGKLKWWQISKTRKLYSVIKLSQQHPSLNFSFICWNIIFFSDRCTLPQIANKWVTGVQVSLSVVRLYAIQYTVQFYC